jgi:hypothetical protein
MRNGEPWKKTSYMLKAALILSFARCVSIAMTKYLRKTAYRRKGLFWSSVFKVSVSGLLCFRTCDKAGTLWKCMVEESYSPHIG